MSFLATRLQRIKPSPTVAVTVKAAALRRAGRDVIGLGAGEPDFDTPAHIREAAVRALTEGKTRYAPPNGIPELRNAICAKLQRDNGLDYGPDQIAVTCGGKQAIFNAFAATLSAGDQVLVPAPYWVSYPDIAALFEGEPIFIECSAAAGFKLTPVQLRAAITPQTKWLVLNSPSNPTGAAYTEAELKALAAVLLEPGRDHVWVMSDDIYEFLVYDNFRFTTFAQVEPRLSSRTLTLNGFSKAYCMTGWRLGYAAGPTDLIAAMTMLQSQSATSAVTFAQWAGVAALNGDHGFVAVHNRAFQARRDLVVGMLNQIPGMSCRTPQGAFYVYPSCAGMIGRRTPTGETIASDEDFVTWMLAAEGVAAVHGAAFGASPYFRISTAVDAATLEEACRRIGRACAALH